MIRQGGPNWVRNRLRSGLIRRCLIAVGSSEKRAFSAHRSSRMSRTQPVRSGMNRRVDRWEGYPAARDRIFRAWATARAPNPLVRSGDVHAFFAAEILAPRRAADRRRVRWRLDHVADPLCRRRARRRRRSRRALRQRGRPRLRPDRSRPGGRDVPLPQRRRRSRREIRHRRPQDVHGGGGRGGITGMT